MKNKIITLLTTGLTVTMNCALAQWQGTSPVYFNAGNVGIGTSNPNRLLHISGSNPAIGFSDNDLPLSSSNPNWILRSKNNGIFSLQTSVDFQTVNELFTVDYNGNVGVGTTSAPSYKLQVKGYDIFLNSANNSSLHFRTDSNGNAFVNNMNNFVGNGSAGNGHLIITGQSGLRFQTGSSGTSGTERMRITDSGRVGIGTANPNTNLEVFGTEGVRITNSTEGNDYMLIKANQNVSSLNPGASTVSALITNRRLGHLVFDISANDNGDSFAIRTDKNLDGEVDEISFVVKPTGKVGIGTTSPQNKLDVNGTIHAKEVKVDLNGWPGPDYVFKKDYPLTSLEELKSYIDQNKHLPEIPSAKEMEEEGINLKEMNLLLLKKVEELTLHLIQQEKINQRQNKELDELREMIKKND